MKKIEDGKRVRTGRGMRAPVRSTPSTLASVCAPVAEGHARAGLIDFSGKHVRTEFAEGQGHARTHESASLKLASMCGPSTRQGIACELVRSTSLKLASMCGPSTR